MIDFIIVVILLILVGVSVRFIWKEKKKGKKCIGCSSGGCSSCNQCGNSMFEK